MPSIAALAASLFPAAPVTPSRGPETDNDFAAALRSETDTAAPARDSGAEPTSNAATASAPRNTPAARPARPRETADAPAKTIATTDSAPGAPSVTEDATLSDADIPAQTTPAPLPFMPQPVVIPQPASPSPLSLDGMDAPVPEPAADTLPAHTPAGKPLAQMPPGTTALIPPVTADIPATLEPATLFAMPQPAQPGGQAMPGDTAPLAAPPQSQANPAALSAMQVSSTPASPVVAQPQRTALAIDAAATASLAIPADDMGDNSPDAASPDAGTDDTGSAGPSLPQSSPHLPAPSLPPQAAAISLPGLPQQTLTPDGAALGDLPEDALALSQAGTESPTPTPRGRAAPADPAQSLPQTAADASPASKAAAPATAQPIQATQQAPASQPTFADVLAQTSPTNAAPPASAPAIPPGEAEGALAQARHGLPGQPLAMPVTEQISLQVRKALDDGNNRIRIKMQPAALGHVEVRLEVGHDGSLKAVVAADRHETFEWLQRDARSLERSLQESGFKTDTGSLSFQYRGGEGGSQQRGFAGQESTPGQRGQRALEATVSIATDASPRPAVATGRLDLNV